MSSNTIFTKSLLKLLLFKLRADSPPRVSVKKIAARVTERRSKSPFLNYLRVFRSKYCGSPQTKIAIEWAKCWPFLTMPPAHHQGLVFNFLLVAGKQSSDWRMNRNTLLLKEGKDGRMTENYRPITISSLISREYYGMLDARINWSRSRPGKKVLFRNLGASAMYTSWMSCWGMLNRTRAWS